MKLLFIVNAISGGIDKHQTIQKIEKLLQKENVLYEIVITNDALSGLNAIEKAKIEKYSAIVAVGGDGTLQSVGAALMCSEIPLGIIPMGSGNGLARMLKCPFNVEAAIRKILNGKVQSIDVAKANDRVFLNVCGVGFDALISNRFAHSEKRGFFNYARLTIQSLSKYKSADYIVSLNGQKIFEKAFLVSICNGNQFGNNAYIAPEAQLNDGLLNLTLLKPFGILKAIPIAVRLFSKKLTVSNQTIALIANHFSLKRKDGLAFHYHVDGEPMPPVTELSIKVLPSMLKVIV